MLQAQNILQMQLNELKQVNDKLSNQSQVKSLEAEAALREASHMQLQKEEAQEQLLCQRKECEALRKTLEQAEAARNEVDRVNLHRPACLSFRHSRY